jgi:transposase
MVDTINPGSLPSERSQRTDTAKIRRAHFVDGKSIKQICRELRVSRNTVRKVIRSGATEFTYGRTTQPRPKIDPWRSVLDAMLAENARRPKRERLTLIRIYEDLRNRGYGGSYDAVRRYAASWSKATQAASASAYVPLSFDPGEAYQFDWSHEIVILDGVTVTVKVAHVRLCHSRMPFVRAYPRETRGRWCSTRMTGRLPSSVGPARGAFTTARPCSPLVQEQWSIVNPGDKMDSGNGRVI